MNDNNKKAGLVLLIVILVIVLEVGLIWFCIGIIRHSQYNSAIALMETGEYKTAMDKFGTLMLFDYKYSKAYYFYCSAHWDVETHGGDYAAGRTALNIFDMLSENMTLLPPDYAEFKEKVDAAYAEYKVRREEEDRIRWEEQRKKEEEAYARKLKGLPFVGMWESDIARTGLGKPSPKIEHNSEMVNNRVKHANLYRWESRPNVVIFTARCIDGKVVQVWDYRANPWDRNHHGPKITPKPRNPGDYLEAWNYDSFEDFFDDCEDFFEDETEAEDYYYEYNDY